MARAKLDYAVLTDTLERLGESKVRLRKAAVVKLGCVRVAESVVADDAELPITQKEQTSPDDKARWNPPRHVGAQIFEALKDHPNVFDPTELLPDPDTILGDRFGIIAHGPTFVLRIDLPRARQKYKEMDCEEHFHVISDGSLFAAFAEIQDLPIYSNIGHEFREIATSQIASHTKLKAPLVGPCPVHSDIILAIRDQPLMEIEEPARTYEISGDLIIVTSDKRSLADIVADYFLDFSGSIEDFYLNQIESEHLRDYEIEVSTCFSRASENVAALLRTPPWKLWVARHLARQAKTNLASLHGRLVELESELNMYGRSRMRFLEGLKKQPDLGKLLPYFREMTDPEIEIPSALSEAMNFVAGELQLYGNIRSLLLASLLGAMVGAVLTGVLGYLVR